MRLQVERKGEEVKLSKSLSMTEVEFPCCDAAGRRGRMTVIWLNGTVGAGKSAVGRALADRLAGAVFVDGDDHAGPRDLPNPVRWRMALDSLLRAVAQAGARRVLVVAYPLSKADHARLRAACGRARHALVVITIAPSLSMTLRGRSFRPLDAAERARVRVMRSEGYHRRGFAALTLPNAQPPAARTAWRIARLIGRPRMNRPG
jgi:hypothetical protein